MLPAIRLASCILLPVLAASFRPIQLAQKTPSRLNLDKCKYDDIIPYLSEHINFSDQILLLGASTDLCIRLVQDQYGVKKTGFMMVLDSDASVLEKCKKEAESDPAVKELMLKGKVKFEHVNYAKMGDVCKQSCVDAIVDCGGIDSVLLKGSSEEAKECVQQLQNAVRLGNVLVSISKLENEQFKVPFESGYGWVQELDGDPGELSAWYRGKSNIQASASNFNDLGLKMFVFTNADNC